MMKMKVINGECNLFVWFASNYVERMMHLILLGEVYGLFSKVYHDAKCSNSFVCIVSYHTWGETICQLDR